MEEKKIKQRKPKCPYKCLTWQQRLQLEAYLKIKMPKKDIAKLLGVHISTVYREVQRGTYKHKQCRIDYYNYGEKKYKIVERYSPDIAQEKYRQGLTARGVSLKIGNDYELCNYIENRIVQGGLTPLAVLGEIKRKNLQFKTEICIRTLYNYIEKGVFLRLSLKHLPLKGARRVHRRKVKVAAKPSRGTSIEKRPTVINDRTSFGHWEMDCVCGPTLETLLTLTERKTRYEIIMPMKNQKADSVIKCLNILERKYGKLFRKTFKSITVDNGSEFSDFVGLEKSIYRGKRTQIYYCHPYCSSERGTNERLNREIRRKIPKGSDLSIYSKEEIKQVENWVNNYPRQIFDFTTSEVLFSAHIQAIL